MRVLFGSEHDGLHIDPQEPGGYEWWYFDAISDDGRYALVVIFFLGTPMSPYYKAVADARKAGRTPPLPLDWCGVFVSLHEYVPRSVVFATAPSSAARRLEGAQWQEVAYAYNIYRAGEFSKEQGAGTLGESEFRQEQSGDWRISLAERGLWFGEVKAQLTFSPVGAPLVHEPVGEEDGHTWVCVAPHCRVTGTVTPLKGTAISFAGDGYHDHNFGRLPWAGVDGWYWGRAHWHCDDDLTRTLLFYLVREGQRQQRIEWVIEGTEITPLPDGAMELAVLEGLAERSPYGLRHFVDGLRSSDQARQRGLFAWALIERSLSDGPFYRRMAMQASGGDVAVHGRGWQGKGIGIAEAFRPERLCHPIWSWLMWTRIRRR